MLLQLHFHSRVNGFTGLGKDNCKMRPESLSFEIWCLILDVLGYMLTFHNECNSLIAYSLPHMGRVNYNDNCCTSGCVDVD